jgi:hypothetical protein
MMEKSPCINILSPLAVLFSRSRFVLSLYSDAISSCDSSALSVLSLQPIFVKDNGGKRFLPQLIICEVLLLPYASVHLRWI